MLSDHISLEKYKQAEYLRLKSNQDSLQREPNFRNLEIQLNLFEYIDYSETIIRSKGRVANADLR